jgi:resuscitation-promoting factor RpfB
MGADRAVRLEVDGQVRTVHTFAGTVRGLLADEGLRPGPHDRVTPAPGRALTDGAAVTVRYGRPVTLHVDGRSRRMWTTARTVADALDRAGVRAEGAALSASRGSRIGRHGADLRVHTARRVTVRIGDRSRTVRTNAATVRGALADAGVHLGRQDTATPHPDSFPREGTRISVLRISGRQVTRLEHIPYGTERRADPERPRGTQATVRRGRPGLRRVTYRFRVVNGVRQRARVVESETVREPQERIVRYGTGAPADGPGADGTEAKGSAGPSADPGAAPSPGGDGLDWQALAQCESGGRPDAVDPSGRYGGLYQMDAQTWHRVGGAGNPQQASPAEQTYRAKKLYASRGASPWPNCGRKLTR